MRKLWVNKQANVAMIIMGVLILIISALAIAIFYPIVSNIDTSAADTLLDSRLDDGNGNFTPGANATNTVVSTANTVMGLNPLTALVAVAAGIISLLLGAFLVGGGSLPKL